MALSTQQIHTFLKLFIESKLLVKTVSHIIDQAEYDALSTALVNVSESAKCTLSVIFQAISSEFERNFRTPGSIMRGNCVASKITSAYARKIASQWLISCIGQEISKIINNDNLSLEVDPSKISSEQALSDQHDLLTKTVQSILDVIFSDATFDSIPPSIRMISGIIADLSRQYADEATTPLIGGFFFLRFLNPALLTPENHGLLASGAALSPQGRRNLILITKIIQNLSNNVEFGKKEAYMIPFNHFLKENQTKMQSFLSKLAASSLPLSSLKSDLEPTHVEISDNSIIQDGMFLHQMFHNYKTKVLSAIQDQLADLEEKELKQLEEFFQVFDTLGIPQKTTSRAAFQLENSSISFLTPLSKSGYIHKKTHNHKNKIWAGLTRTFLFLMSSPQDLVPLKSIPLNTVFVNSLKPNSEEGFCFQLHYNNKSHLVYVQSQQDVEDWMNSITSAVQRHTSDLHRGAFRQQSAIEMRIKNALLGLQIPFNFLYHGIKCEDSGRISFKFKVEAFGSTFVLQKYLSEILKFHEELRRVFNRNIFAAFASVGEQPQHANLDKHLIKGRKTNEIDGDLAVHLIFHFNGQLSRAAQNLQAFLRAYFMDLRLNIALSQSSLLLNFFEICSPMRAVQQSSLAHLQYLHHLGLELAEIRDNSGRTALHNAAARGACDALRWLLEHHPSSRSVTDNDGNTPLLAAIFNNQEAAAELLISLNQSFGIKTPNRKGTPPIHGAAKRNFLSLCKLLLDSGVNVDHLNRKRQTALMKAAKHDLVEMVQLLLSRGANIIARDNDNNSILSYAALGGSSKVLQFLLKYPLWPSVSELEAATAEREGDETKEKGDAEGNPQFPSKLSNPSPKSSLDVLLSSRGSHESTPLHLAAMSGVKQVVHLLLNAGASPVLFDKSNHTPMHVAALCDNEEIVVTLGICQLSMDSSSFRNSYSFRERSRRGTLHRLAAESDANSPLHDAARLGLLKIASRLVKVLNFDVDAANLRGETPLLQAVKYHQPEVAVWLLKANADPNIVDDCGRSCLYIAAIRGDRFLCQYLLQYESDPNITTFEGVSPLLAATLAKQNQVVKLLLSEGANLNLANAAELNPWQAAILGGNTLIAMLLAQSGADIDQRDKEGRTALHVAIENNFSHLACSLINCGCNLNIANKEGLRPIHLAISQNNDLVIRRLVESGCEIPESHKNKIKISIRENPNRQSAVLLKPVSLSFLTCTLITPGERKRCCRVQLHKILSVEQLESYVRDVFDIAGELKIRIEVEYKDGSKRVVTLDFNLIEEKAKLNAVVVYSLE